MRASKLASLATLVATAGLAVLLALTPVDASPLALTTTNDARASLSCCDCVGGNCLPRCCDDVKSTLDALALRAFYGVEAPRGHLKQDQDRPTPFASRALDEASTVPSVPRALDHADAAQPNSRARDNSIGQDPRDLEKDLKLILRGMIEPEPACDHGCKCPGSAERCADFCCYLTKRALHELLGITPAAGHVTRGIHVADSVARAVPDRGSDSPLSVQNVKAGHFDSRTITQLAQRASGNFTKPPPPCHGCRCPGTSGYCTPSCCHIAKRSFYGLLGLSPAAGTPDPAVRDFTPGQAEPRTATHVTQLMTRGDDPPDDPPVCYGCPCAGPVGVCSPACCYIAKRSFYGLLGLTPASAAPQLAARGVTLIQAEPRTAIHEVNQLARRGDSPPDPPECCACNEYFCSHTCCADFKENDVEASPAIRTLPAVEDAHAEASLVPKEVNQCAGLGCPCDPYSCSELCCATSEATDTAVASVIQRTIHGIEAADPGAALVPKELSKAEKRDYCSQHGLGCECGAGWCSEDCCSTSQAKTIETAPAVYTFNPAQPEATLVFKDLMMADKRDYCGEHGYGCECYVGVCSPSCCATSEATRSLDSATAAQLAVRAVQAGHGEPRAGSLVRLIPNDVSETQQKRDYCSEHGYGSLCSSGFCAHDCCPTLEQARGIDNPPATRALHGVEAGYLIEEPAKREQLGEEARVGVPSSMLVKRPVGCDKPGRCLCADTGECSADCCHGTTSRALSSKEVQLGGSLKVVKRQGCLGGCPCDPEGAYCSIECCTPTTSAARALHGGQARSNDVARALLLGPGQHQEEIVQRRHVKMNQVGPHSSSENVQLGGSLKAAKRQGCLGGACPCDPNGAYCSFECCTTKGMDGRAIHGDQPRSNDIARAFLGAGQPEEQLRKRNERGPRDVKSGHFDFRALAQNNGLELGVVERHCQGDSCCCTCVPEGGCLLECCARWKETAPELVRALDGKEEAAPRVLSDGEGPHEEPTREQ